MEKLPATTYKPRTLRSSRVNAQKETIPLTSARHFLKADELTQDDFEAAFPGQAVCLGKPNQMRRAMHCARGLIRATQAEDIVLAEVWLRALHRATTVFAMPVTVNET